MRVNIACPERETEEICCFLVYQFLLSIFFFVLIVSFALFFFCFVLALALVLVLVLFCVVLFSYLTYCYFRDKLHTCSGTSNFFPSVSRLAGDDDRSTR